MTNQISERRQSIKEELIKSAARQEKLAELVALMAPVLKRLDDDWHDLYDRKSDQEQSTSLCIAMINHSVLELKVTLRELIRTLASNDLIELSEFNSVAEKALNETKSSHAEILSDFNEEKIISNQNELLNN